MTRFRRPLTILLAILLWAILLPLGSTAQQLSQPLAQGQIPGTATNDNAAPGMFGEYVSATLAPGSAIVLTTATAATVISIPLTAGDWDVRGTVYFGGAAATTPSIIQACTWTLGNTMDATVGGNSSLVPATGSTPFAVSVPTIQLVPRRFSLSAAGTVYLNVTETFAGGTATAYGFLAARRVR